MLKDDKYAGTVAVQKSLNDAMDFQIAGRLGQAEDAYVQVLFHNYRAADVLPLLAGVVAKRGDANLAIYYWDKLLAIAPDNILAFLEKGSLLRQLNRSDEAIACYETALLAAPKNQLVLNNLAVVLDEVGQTDAALRMFERALALQPLNINLRHQIRRLTSRVVPFWHIAMMNDTRRNDAFEEAIRRAIALRGTDAQVLDIGAGSGLLSMMAAREGAKGIVTCETVSAIADTARHIVQENGYAKQIKVVSKPSTMLTVGEDINRPADILVSEILSSDLLAEHVLTTFEDAHARLIVDDAIIIPKAAAAIGCLVASDNLASYSHVGRASGFDLSAFNNLAPERLPLHGTMTSWERLSEDFEIVAIDLTRKTHAPGLRKIVIPIRATGIAIGVVQWMNVSLIDDIIFSNHPDDYHDGGWLQVLHTFPAPIQVTAGDDLSLFVGHDRSSLILTPA